MKRPFRVSTGGSWERSSGIQHLQESQVMQTHPGQQAPQQRRLDGFDRVVLAGAIVNGLVVLYLLGYWLVH
jgi:hypothetical protein